MIEYFIVLQQIEDVLKAVITYYHDHLGVSWGFAIVMLTVTVSVAGPVLYRNWLIVNPFPAEYPVMLMFPQVAVQVKVDPGMLDWGAMAV